jgi:hypothetical protein
MCNKNITKHRVKKSSCRNKENQHYQHGNVGGSGNVGGMLEEVGKIFGVSVLIFGKRF